MPIDMTAAAIAFMAGALALFILAEELMRINLGGNDLNDKERYISSVIVGVIGILACVATTFGVYMWAKMYTDT